MKTWSFYRKSDGLFLGREFSAPYSECLAQNTPAGCVAIEGVFDRLSQCVDLTSGQVVSYQPPQPDENHEWNATTKRWVKRAEVIAREAQRAQALTRIDELERRQHRRLRELLAASDPQLKAIDDEIAELRQALK